MPRFFFNVYDGHSDIDDVGVELTNLDAARCETVRFASEVLAEDAKRMTPGEDWRLEVTDQDRLLLFRFDVSFMESPAVKRSRNLD